MAKNEKDYINEIEGLKAEIDAFQMSENEANEIIAELEAENKRLKDIIKSISQPVLLPDVPIEVTNKYKQTLQEIKAIAEYIMASDTEKWTLDEPFKQIEKILELIKAEEE